MPTRLDFYLLDPAEVLALRAQNRAGAQISPCDHGQGPCIDADDLDQPYLAAHRTALDNRGRINARTRVPIDLPDEAESRENTSPR